MMIRISLLLPEGRFLFLLGMLSPEDSGYEDGMGGERRVEARIGSLASTSALIEGEGKREKSSADLLRCS